MIVYIQQQLSSQLIDPKSEFQGYGETIQLLNSYTVFHEVKESGVFVYLEIYPQKITLDEFKMNELLQTMKMNFSFEAEYLAMGYEDCYLSVHPTRQADTCPYCGEEA